MTFGHAANTGMAVDINPSTAIARNAQQQGDSVVILYAGEQVTYSQLADQVARLASALTDGGVVPGDRVAYIGLNSPAFLVTMLASFRVGAIFVPVNFRLAGPELRAVLELSGTVVAVVEEGHRDSVEAVREGIAIKRLLLVDDDCLNGKPGWEQWSEVLSAGVPTTQAASTRFDDPAILMFTSGTTGSPKGVTLTYANLWWNSVNVDARIDTRRGDVTYAAAPLFHVGALNSFVLRTLVRGGTVLLQRSFEPQQFLADLVEHQVNSCFAVPAMVAALRRVPGFFEADLSQLRAIIVAGAPVPPSLIQEFAEHEIWLQQAWGLTETAPFATHLPIERTLDKIGSAGVAMPYTEVRVVDAMTNETVAAGTAGEVVVRGPNVTPGYWENDVATRAAFDKSGWFHSGDVGYLDDDGFLYIVDRLKDMVISGGENIYPAEVERVLADMPGINDVAVVGTPDEKWGESVVAVVSLNENVSVTLDEIRSYAATALARYKLPQKLRIVDRMPRNASGKLEKLLIRKLVTGQKSDE